MTILLPNRPTCDNCHALPCAINYRKGNKVYYRKMCVSCINKRKKDKTVQSQLLNSSGYKKKSTCDRCNFQARHHSQLSIVFLDGQLANVSRTNLRTYCANCIAELSVMPSRRNSIVPDY